MRRILIAIGTTLTGLVLLFSFPTSLNRIASATAVGAAAGTTATTGTTTADAASAKAAADAAAAAAPVTYDGAVVSTRYGNVQVRITVSGGAVSAAEAIAYPSNDGQSRQISNYAVPVLNQSASAAKSANISMVSGATYTSTGYITSLQSALDQAKL